MFPVYETVPDIILSLLWPGFFSLHTFPFYNNGQSGAPIFYRMGWQMMLELHIEAMAKMHCRYAGPDEIYDIVRS